MFAGDEGNQTLFKGSPLQFNRRMTNVHHEPVNLKHPYHRVVRQTARQGPFWRQGPHGEKLLNLL